MPSGGVAAPTPMRVTPRREGRSSWSAASLGRVGDRRACARTRWWTHPAAARGPVASRPARTRPRSACRHPRARRRRRGPSRTAWPASARRVARSRSSPTHVGRERLAAGCASRQRARVVTDDAIGLTISRRRARRRTLPVRSRVRPARAPTSCLRRSTGRSSGAARALGSSSGANESPREKRASFRDETYWGRPVPGFGDPQARVLIAGLAPAAHGGQPHRPRLHRRSFRRLGSSVSLYRVGFANQPTSVSVDDGLELRDAYVSGRGAVRAAGQQADARPSATGACRISNASSRCSSRVRVVVVLGGFAYEAVRAGARRVRRRRCRCRDRSSLTVSKW